MPKTAYPTYADLSVYFANVGVALPDQSFCDDLLEAIKEEVTDVLGYTLFNTTAASTTQKYNYPSNTGILWTRELYNSVSNVSLNGVAQVQSTDYWFDDSRQFTFNIGSGYFPLPEAVSVTGVVGFTTNIPTMLWRGVLDYASWKVIYMNPQRVFKQLKQGDVDMTFDKPMDVPRQFWDLIEGYRY